MIDLDLVSRRQKNYQIIYVLASCGTRETDRRVFIGFIHGRLEGGPRAHY